MNPLRGIALKILSVLVFTLMAICIKASAPHVPPGERVFFRSFFAIPVILAGLVVTRRLRYGLNTRNPLGHFWRGLVGTSSMGLGFTALGLLPLPEATAIGYAAPLLTVIFAAMFLGERSGASSMPPIRPRWRASPTRGCPASRSRCAAKRGASARTRAVMSSRS